VFTSDRDGDNEIYRMSPNGSNVQQLTFNAVDDEYPNWSPDGRMIVFNSDRDDNFDVYSMRAWVVIDDMSSGNLTIGGRPITTEGVQEILVGAPVGA